MLTVIVIVILILMVMLVMLIRCSGNVKTLSSFIPIKTFGVRRRNIVSHLSSCKDKNATPFNGIQ